MVRASRLLPLPLACAALVATSGTIAAQAPSVEVVQVANTLSSAIGLTNAGDGSGRLFVVQQSGEIRIWDGAQVLVAPFLDVGSLVSGGGEQGLLGLAFHPDYATNGFFYVNYTNLSGDTVVAHYSVSADDPDVADPASAPTGAAARSGRPSPRGRPTRLPTSASVTPASARTRTASSTWSRTTSSSASPTRRPSSPTASSRARRAPGRRSCLEPKTPRGKMSFPALRRRLGPAKGDEAPRRGRRDVS